MDATKTASASHSVRNCTRLNKRSRTQWRSSAFACVLICISAAVTILTQRMNHVFAADSGQIDAEEFPEFESYVEAVKQRERDDIEYEDMMTRHEHWRQTTLMGRTVMGLQYIARHPFFTSVFSLAKNTDTSTVYGIFLINLDRIALLVLVFLAVYLMGYVVKLLLGEEIVVEERIVVINEVTKSGKKIRSTEISQESEFIQEQEKQQSQRSKPRREKKSRKED